MPIRYQNNVDFNTGLSFTFSYLKRVAYVGWTAGILWTV
jgi:hypothetical protein